MTALHWRRRRVESALESVDDFTQMEQVGWPAEAVPDETVIRRLIAAGLICLPVSPFGRNERPAAVGQAYEQEQDIPPADAADHRQHLAFKRVPLPDNHYRGWDLPVMGSLWPCPSTRLATSG